jgi:serine phosphatase RsbU (regulator of sigma subunit)
MASLKLKALLNTKSAGFPALSALHEALGGGLRVVDAAGNVLFGEASSEASTNVAHVPVLLEETALGFVVGAAVPASALALLLTHLAARESEGRALAAEVLHLYREVNLIEQLSEQLAAILNLPAVGQSALAQAQRLIPATHGAILVTEKAGDPLRSVASFGSTSGDSSANIGALLARSGLVASVLERGIGEIINDCASDSRALPPEHGLGSLMVAPLRAGLRTVGIIALATDCAGTSYSSADFKLLNTIALQTAAAIENSLLCADMVDAVRDREQLAAIQHELETARTIQHLLVPRTFPPFPERPDFELHAQMTSARAVGGDFFDFFLIDEDRLGIVIGDVSGKGIPAALYMAVTRTQVKTTAQRGMSPAECFLEVNRFLVKERVSAMFATCFYGVLQLSSGDFQYCSAGHNPAYLLRADGNIVEPIADVGGIPLGLFDGLGYIGSSIRLQPGDAVFLYTDGVPEARDAAEEDFTDERLIATLNECAAFTCKDLIGYVTTEVAGFTRGAPQSDDITMLSVRRAGGLS